MNGDGGEYGVELACTVVGACAAWGVLPRFVCCTCCVSGSGCDTSTAGRLPGMLAAPPFGCCAALWSDAAVVGATGCGCTVTPTLDDAR